MTEMAMGALRHIHEQEKSARTGSLVSWSTNCCLDCLRRRWRMHEPGVEAVYCAGLGVGLPWGVRCLRHESPVSGGHAIDVAPGLHPYRVEERFGDRDSVAAASAVEGRDAVTTRAGDGVGDHRASRHRGRMGGDPGRESSRSAITPGFVLETQITPSPSSSVGHRVLPGAGTRSLGSTVAVATINRACHERDSGTRRSVNGPASPPTVFRQRA